MNFLKIFFFRFAKNYLKCHQQFPSSGDPLLPKFRFLGKDSVNIIRILLNRLLYRCRFKEKAGYQFTDNMLDVYVFWMDITFCILQDPTLLNNLMSRTDELLYIITSLNINLIKLKWFNKISLFFFKHKDISIFFVR